MAYLYVHPHVQMHCTFPSRMDQRRPDASPDEVVEHSTALFTAAASAAVNNDER
jgi:hypothetical protein